MAHCEKKLNVVFDLNGTLLAHTFGGQHVDAFYEELKKETPYVRQPVEIAHTLAHPRPFARELLEWVVQHCNVAVWTFSARDDRGKDGLTATNLAKAVFGPLFKHVQLVLDRRSRTAKKRKDLKFVWDRLPHWRKGHTILVDDSKHKFCEHQKHHGVLVPTYDYRLYTKDTVLTQLKSLLVELHAKVQREESPLHQFRGQYLDLHPQCMGKSKKQIDREIRRAARARRKRHGKKAWFVSTDSTHSKDTAKDSSEAWPLPAHCRRAGKGSGASARLRAKGHSHSGSKSSSARLALAETHKPHVQVIFSEMATPVLEPSEQKTVNSSPLPASDVVDSEDEDAAQLDALAKLKLTAPARAHQPALEVPHGG